MRLRERLCKNKTAGAGRIDCDLPGFCARLSLPLRLFFVLSGAALTCLLSLKGTVGQIGVGVVCALAALCLLAFRLRFLERVFSLRSVPCAVGSGVLALYGAFRYGAEFLGRVDRLVEEAPALAGFVPLAPAAAIAGGVLCVFALFTYLYAFISRFAAFVGAFLREAERVERAYLMIACVAAAALILAAYAKTTVFYGPNIDDPDVWNKIDIVYTTDTASLLQKNVYLIPSAPENDIRQPLFGVFAAPFALLADLVARLVPVNNAYAALMALMQAALLLFSLVLTARLLPLAGARKALFLSCCTFLYPTLLFLLNLEQYVFACFYLVALLYRCAREEGDTAVCWAAATGSLLTSGITLLFLPERKRLSDWVLSCLRAAGAFFAAVLLFGRLPVLLDALTSLGKLTQFAGEQVGFVARMQQYCNFVRACMIAPAAGVQISERGITSFQLAPVTGWSAGGIALLIVCVAGWFFNRRNRFANLCACWAAFSFLLLGLAGWGTRENGLVLYTLYFSFAFAALTAFAIEALPVRNGGKVAIYAVALAALLICNIPATGELIAFGARYYPVR